MKNLDLFKGHGSYVIINPIEEVEKNVFYGIVKYTNSNKNILSGSHVYYIKEEDKSFTLLLYDKHHDVILHYCIFLILDPLTLSDFNHKKMITKTKERIWKEGIIETI
jgi:hypothetical protein